jgi:membrane-associated phospholipid phosphatase
VPCTRSLVLFFSLIGLIPSIASAQLLLPDSPSSSVARAQLSLPTSFLMAGAPDSGNSADESNAHRLFRRGLADQKAIYTLPLQRKNLKWTALFLAGTGGLIAADRHITGAIPSDHADVSRTISNVGLYSMLGTVGIIGLAGWRSGDDHERETALLSGEASAHSAVVLLLTRLITLRERPLDGNGHGDFWSKTSLDSSFPSGHSTFTWTLASVVAHEYPRPWVQALAYGTATTVSVTRVTGLRHFSADVAVGGVFGYFIGQHIFHAHCKVCSTSP